MDTLSRLHMYGAYVTVYIVADTFVLALCNTKITYITHLLLGLTLDLNPLLDLTFYAN